MAHGLAGAMDMFERHVPEIGTLIGWARESAAGKVAVGGINLDALNSQMAVAHCHGWPEAMRPDAALFVTTTDRPDEIAWESGFARGFGSAAAMEQAGWRREAAEHWLPLIGPLSEPGIPPEQVVMALGTADIIAHYRNGRPFAERWGIPPNNLLETWQGHFSKAIGLTRFPAPIDRLCALLCS